MASTRNKSTIGDYNYTKRQNARYQEIGTYLGTTACYPGDGIIAGGNFHGSLLSYNCVDIESELFGIVSNLENPRDKIIPELKHLKTLCIINKNSKIIYPEPLIVDKYNRPSHT
jgi:hypothetical protein